MSQSNGTLSELHAAVDTLSALRIELREYRRLLVSACASGTGAGGRLVEEQAQRIQKRMKQSAHETWPKNPCGHIFAALAGLFLQAEWYGIDTAEVDPFVDLLSAFIGQLEERIEERVEVAL